MANVLLKHLLSYGSAGNAGLVVADAAALSAYGSEMVRGVCTDWSGNVYLTDEAKHIIVKVTEGGQVSLFAGIANTSGLTNGARGVATFNGPTGISCDRSGKMFVSDTGNKKIKAIRNDYTVFGIVGPTFRTGDNFHVLEYIEVDNSGFIYVVDYNDATDLSRLIKMGQDGQESTMEIIVEPDVTKIGIAVSPNQTLYVTQSEAELESWSSSSSSVSSSVSSISSPSSSSVSSVSSVSR